MFKVKNILSLNISTLLKLNINILHFYFKIVRENNHFAKI